MLTRYINFIAECDAGKLHPFFVLGLIIQFCKWESCYLQPAAPEGVQAGDSVDEAVIFSASSNNQEHF